MASNSMSISNLMDDTLYNIFLCFLSLADTETKSNVSGIAPSYRKEQLKITHVCRHWRNLAIRSPKIWSIIDHTQHPETLPELIARSQQAPLTIRWDTLRNPEDDVASIKAFLREMSRTENISLSATRKTHDEIASEAPREAPYLKAVTFIDKLMQDERESHPLPTLLDDCDMPNLQSVRLIGYKVTSWSKALFPSSLTHLFITVQHRYPWTPGTVSFWETLAAIAHMPGLVDLELSHCIAAPFTSQPFPAVRPEKRITLAHLQSLTLSSLALICAHFLDHLIVPASATISVSFTYNPSIPEVTKFPIILDSVLSKLLGSTVIGQRRTFRSATITHFNKVYLCLWSDVHDIRRLECNLFNNDFPTPSFRMIIYESWDDVDTWSFLATLPLHDVEVFRIDDCAAERRSHSAILALFRRMAHISTMHVTDVGRINWVRKVLLSHAKDQDENEGNDGKQPVVQNPYLLSHLRTLVVDLPFAYSGRGKRRDDIIALMVGVSARRDCGIGPYVFEMLPPAGQFEVSQRRRKYIADLVDGEAYALEAAHWHWESARFMDFNTDNETDSGFDLGSDIDGTWEEEPEAEEERDGINDLY